MTTPTKLAITFHTILALVLMGLSQDLAIIGFILFGLFLAIAWDIKCMPSVEKTLQQAKLYKPTL